jgi:hypothetical protein
MGTVFVVKKSSSANVTIFLPKPAPKPREASQQPK